MEDILGILVAIIAIICIFGLPVILGAYVLVKLIGSNSKERLELARHGIIPPDRVKPAPNKYRSLRNGILCLGIGLGLVLGIIINLNNNFEYYIEFLIVCSSTIIFMGLSYITFYVLVRNKNLDNDLDNDIEE